MKTDIPQLLLMITIAMKENKNMRTFTIKLNEIDKIKAFVKTVNECCFDIEIQSDKYIINAKSIMGIFSLDLSQPVTLVVHADKAGDITNLIKALSDLQVLVCEKFGDDE